MGRLRIDHILKDFIRRLEAKRRRVADVQLEDAVAFLLQAFGVLEHWAANVVADIGELVRFAELHDGIPIEKTRYAPPKGLKGQEAGARLNAWHTKPTNIRATRAPEKTVRGEIQPAEVPT